MNKLKPKLSVAIIGAGLAGLSCADRLQTLGFQVHVYEKSRGPSGRMSTRHGEGWSADHGAQYFTARDPVFIEALNTWIKAGVAANWNPCLSIYEGEQWREGNSTEHRYVGVPAMNSPGQYLAKTISIEFNQTIDKIYRQDGKWFLHGLENGEITQSFDYLVLAIPSPQSYALAKLVDHSIGAICSSVNMQGCWTVMARFSDKENMPFDAAFINGGIISWISRNNSKPGRTGQEAWTIHANPQWSQQWIELNKEEASKRILESAKKLGLNCQNAEISIHRWRYASGAINTEMGFILNEGSKLNLCGDWLNGGRVEGAWLSGYKLANAMNISAETNP
ncbi:NAD(P)/FAD-dependent oxidoreductase [Polynucleobacter sp. AP-Kaivos-20-H2]|uniref:NAD(P)/FAD-dependent oxidoreductase n=1 Tax=Polynucleobacter sp. AP-Kaivos-20-H2 TaxID=2689104 RepID=UPI001C0AFABA|nr:FAD-dependent oxidoreductase [Polynucleobacter sp. AP-Kaivos-20-H2]MBU3605044.1 NAD(P)-binding protein [Polynucleobacter sp. AP-Kaivos-20-H2]